MSEDLHVPQVIDLDALLRPISEESPSGDSLRYSGVYDEIAEARRADDDLVQGEWRTELKVADYNKVVDLAVSALNSQSKDLQIAAWLSEALIKTHGFAGLRDSLKLAAGLQDGFWDTLYPIVDEGDMEGRANAISWLEAQGADAVKSCPYTSRPAFGYNDWQDAKTFDVPANVESLSAEEQQRYAELRARAEKENRVTSEMWKSAVAQTRRAHVESVNFTIEECWTALAELNRVIEEKFDRNQMPGLGNLKKSLDDVHGQVKKLLERKRAEEPDEIAVEEPTGDEGDGAENEASESNRGGGGGGGPIKGRPEALKRLGEIAAYFERTEPHSPVSYLVQRAVKWGNMPLENWLQDVIHDELVLSQLREMLGISGPAGDGSPVGEGGSSVQSETPVETASSDW